MIDTFIEQARLKVITKQYLGTVARYRQEGNRFYFYDNTSTVEVLVLSDTIIRVRMAPKGYFLDDFSYATRSQPYPFTCERFEFAENDTHYAVVTAAVKCMVNKATFEFSFENHDGLVVNSDRGSMHWEENTEYGGFHVYCSKQMQEAECIYGLSDKPTDMNLRGKRFAFWNSDTYAFEKGRDPLYRTIPFYIGLHHNVAYGLFFDNTFRSQFDFGKENAEVTSFWSNGGEMQYYYIHGPHMMDVVKRYARITGTHPMPPMWALGYHQCRWSYYPEAKLQELAQTFRQKRIPCDALYLDIDYMDGYRCFTWNQEYFPDPVRMIGELRQQGFRTVVIIDPGIKVDDDYPVYQEGCAHNYFCRRSDDYYMEGPVWPGRCRFPDFTSPAVRKWWGGLFRDLVEAGVAGVWNDMNEPSVFGSETFPNDVRHDYDGQGGSHRKAHNVYGMQMVRATYDGLKRLMRNRRPFTITRAGYAGMQRYGSTWTGDNVASWEHLHLASIMQQRLSLSGVSFSGSDIGGFTGHPDGELYTRWIQLGAFSPLMRTHSAGDTPAREPWTYGEPYESICRKFIELRYRLLPYLYSAFWEHHRYGFPIIRPLVMHEQANPMHLFRQDEFTFGDKILACPVLQPGAEKRVIYLPTGDWFNYWTDEPVAGGQEHIVSAPLDTMPIFIKSGSVIPEYPLMQYTGEFEIKELILNVYCAPVTANSFLYEDHGDTFAYEQDIYTEKKFHFVGDAQTYHLSQTSEGLYTPRYDTYKLRLRGLRTAPAAVWVNEQPAEGTWDATNRLYELNVLKSFAHIRVTVGPTASA